jgi:hypothetical protein
MGWDVSNISKNQKTAEYVYNDLKRGLHPKWEILAYGQGRRKYGSVPIYFAMKNIETGEVTACITLADRKNGQIAQKDIWENSGPLCFDCPKKVFELLTPTENSFAQEWREKVKSHYAKPKLEIGDNVVFDREINFVNGWSGNSFIWLGGSKFELSNGGKVQISNWRSFDHGVIKQKSLVA